MVSTDEKKLALEHHRTWTEGIVKRNEEHYSSDSNWFPFVQNIEDVLSRLEHMTQRFDDLDNRSGETQGMIKNLRKIWIKLEVIDDRVIF